MTTTHRPIYPQHIVCTNGIALAGFASNQIFGNFPSAGVPSSSQPSKIESIKITNTDTIDHTIQVYVVDFSVNYLIAYYYLFLFVTIIRCNSN